jgi:hypothetical protein
MANNFKRSIQDKEYSTRSTFTVVLIEKSIHSGRSFLRFGKILLYFPRVVDQKSVLLPTSLHKFQYLPVHKYAPRFKLARSLASI